MAKINIQKNKKTEKLIKPNLWLENKISRVRSFAHPQAARFSKMMVFLLLFGFLVVNMASYFLPKNKFRIAQEQILDNPLNLEAHLILAEEFLKNNQIEEAQNELLVAQEITNNEKAGPQSPSVLGASNIIETIKNRLAENSRKETEKQIIRWRQIVADNLEYRDGYLRLAIYYFKVGDDQKAKENLQTALKIDPNFEPAKILEKSISPLLP